MNTPPTNAPRMNSSKTLRTAVLAALLAFVPAATGRAHDGPRPPGAFSRVTLNARPWQFPNFLVGVDFFPNGQMYVWEKNGIVSLVDESTGQKTGTLLDLTEEVANWGTNGLLSVITDYNFEVNGYIYLLYAVDRHHLYHFGTPSYDPDTSETFAASIARVTRYRVRAEDNFQSVDPASRHVVLGSSFDDGIPILSNSHSVGSVAQGNDGTLIISVGDGHAESQFEDQAVQDGIIEPEEAIGPWRSQLLESHSGKILRVDPVTGEGLPSNPFYVPGEANTARSRIWALGVRQPFRMHVKPGTGSHDVEDGDPGVIVFGEVGEAKREELNVLTGPGANCGWPIYEGNIDFSTIYNPNYEYPGRANPNYDGGATCDKEFYDFVDFIAQDTQNTPQWSDECGNAIDPEYPVFVHHRPKMAWSRWNSSGWTRIPSFDEAGEATEYAIDNPASPIQGPTHPGECIILGDWILEDSLYPTYFWDTLMVADFDNGWMINVEFDENHDVSEVRHAFGLAQDGPHVEELTHAARHPITGQLYGIRTPLRIVRFDWSIDGNQAPVAVAESDITFGPGPLAVQFTGGNSSDDQQTPAELTYAWDFGDGSPVSTDMNPQHTYTPPVDVPTRYDVILTVTDANGISNTTALIVSANNTPPTATILSPLPGDEYVIHQQELWDLIASVDDAESPGELECSWIVNLHHNDHYHVEPTVNDCSTTGFTEGEGCEDLAVYWYRMEFTVTDPHGLSTTQDVLVYPDCSAVDLDPYTFDDFALLPRSASTDVDVLDNDIYYYGTIDPATVTIAQQPVHGTATPDPVTGVITYAHNGSFALADTFTYTVADTLGEVSEEGTVSVTISAPCPADVNSTGQANGVPDGLVDLADIQHYLTLWQNDFGQFGPSLLSDITTTGANNGVPDGHVNLSDLQYYLTAWQQSLGLCS